VGVVRAKVRAGGGLNPWGNDSNNGVFADGERQHTLTHSHTHSLAHSLTNSPTHSLTPNTLTNTHAHTHTHSNNSVLADGEGQLTKLKRHVSMQDDYIGVVFED